MFERGRVSTTRGHATLGGVHVRIVTGQTPPESVERLLRELPEWFGIEQSIVDYADAARALDSVAATVDDKVVGVCLIRHHNSRAAEIEVLAVQRSLHRCGIGRRLLERAEADLRSSGTQLLQVKTLGPSGHSTEYARTRAFYEAVGYIPLEERNDIWGAENPCLILVKALA